MGRRENRERDREKDGGGGGREVGFERIISFNSVHLVSQRNTLS